MFKRIRECIYWWKISKKAKKYLQHQIVMARHMDKYPPPTPEEVKTFVEEWKKFGCDVTVPNFGSAKFEGRI